MNEEHATHAAFLYFILLFYLCFDVSDVLPAAVAIQ